MKTRSGRQTRPPGYLSDYEIKTYLQVRICDPEAFRGERPDTKWMTFGIVWADATQSVTTGRIEVGKPKMYFLIDVVDEVIRRGHMIKTSHMYKMLKFLAEGTPVTLAQLLEKMGTSVTYLMHNAEADMQALRNTCEFMNIEFPPIKYKCTKRFIDDTYRDALVHDYEGENSVPFMDTRLESLYKWSTNNPRFVQSHIGSEDVSLLHKSLERIASKFDKDLIRNLIHYTPGCTS